MVEAGNGHKDPKDLLYTRVYDTDPAHMLEYTNIPLDKVLPMSMIPALRDEFNNLCESMVKAQKEYGDNWLYWHDKTGRAKDQIELRRDYIKYLKDVKPPEIKMNKAQSLLRCVKLKISRYIKTKEKEIYDPIKEVEDEIKLLEQQLKDNKTIWDAEYQLQVKEIAAILKEMESEITEATLIYDKWLYYWCQARRSVMGEHIKRGQDTIDAHIEAEAQGGGIDPISRLMEGGGRSQ